MSKFTQLEFAKQTSDNQFLFYDTYLLNPYNIVLLKTNDSSVNTYHRQTKRLV